MQVCVCILYLHVDLRRLASRTLFEAVTDAFTKESEQQVDSTMALAICENKVTFSERSYAHCSMSIYMHPRTFDPCLGDESRLLPVGIYIHACTFGRVLHRATGNESSWARPRTAARASMTRSCTKSRGACGTCWGMSSSASTGSEVRGRISKPATSPLVCCQMT